MTKTRLDNHAAPDKTAETLPLRVELGRQWMTADDVARLTAGSVIELSSPHQGAVDVLAGGRPAASGELVVVEGRLGVRVRRISGIESCTRLQAE